MDIGMNIYGSQNNSWFRGPVTFHLTLVHIGLFQGIIKALQFLLTFAEDIHIPQKMLVFFFS